MLEGGGGGGGGLVCTTDTAQPVDAIVCVSAADDSPMS